MVEQARERGVAVVLDAERDPSPAVRALVGAADHLVIPRAFGEMLTGAQAPGDIAAELWSEHRTAIVLTEGTRGAHGGSGDQDQERLGLHGSSGSGS